MAFAAFVPHGACNGNGTLSSGRAGRRHRNNRNVSHATCRTDLARNNFDDAFGWTLRATYDDDGGNESKRLTDDGGGLTRTRKRNIILGRSAAAFGGR